MIARVEQTKHSLCHEVSDERGYFAMMEVGSPSVELRA